jgi:hypothetical protein
MPDDMNRGLAALVSTRLTSHADSAPVFGTRVFPVIAPQNTPYPLLCYRRLSVQATASLSGTVDRPVVTLELKIYDRTYAGAIDAAKAARKALNGFRGTLGSCTVQRTTFTGETDNAEVPMDAQMLPDYTVTQTYEMRCEDVTA